MKDVETLPECGYVETLRETLAGKLEMVQLGTMSCIKVTRHPDITGLSENALTVNYIPFTAVTNIIPASPQNIQDSFDRAQAAKKDQEAKIRQLLAVGIDPSQAMRGMGSEKRGRS